MTPAAGSAKPCPSKRKLWRKNRAVRKPRFTNSFEVEVKNDGICRHLRQIPQDLVRERTERLSSKSDGKNGGSMNVFLFLYRRVIMIIGFVLKYFGIILLTGIVLSIFSQVISRYCFSLPLVWVEEFATYSFIWLVFMGAAYALIEKRHLVVTTVTDCLPEKIQKILSVLMLLLILVFLIQVIRYGIKQYSLEGMQMTISLPLRLPRRWFYSLPFVISMMIMLFTTIYNIFEKIFSEKREE
jgi:TRAP-type C4-dicarboxylate transport system permease small subunit